MLCAKCGREIMKEAAFCPYCGEKTVRGEPGTDDPVYQADVKGLLKSGKLVVYRDRTEFVSSSVQKTIFHYAGLVSVKKEWDHIDFITEDGRRESCPASRKIIHEAFLYIEQTVSPYLAQRKDRLLAQGVRYSFPSSQGFLNDGVLNLSAEQAEFRAKSGKIDVISFQDVKSVSAPAGTLDFALFGGGSRSFAIGKELKNEVLAFAAGSIAPYLAQRKEALLARGIYFSFSGPNDETVDILAGRVEYKRSAGQTEAVSFCDVRKASLYADMLELALTDGTSKSFPIDADDGNEVLAFVTKAIAPYVTARTAGFDMAFGIDERIEINEERGVFHIIRQDGREITDEWPLDALARCEWTERTELTALGSVVSGGIALFKSAAKAAGSQTASESEERISCAGVVLTIRTERGDETESVWFGIFPAGMSRTNRKYDRYLTEWSGFADYLDTRCPACELIRPVPPERPAENAAEAVSDAPETFPAANAGGEAGDGKAPAPAAYQDDLGIAKYIDGVSRFIGSCDTPMTIAFQGNRGNGENNSILGMLFERLKEQYGTDLLWVNARQILQSGSDEPLPILAGKKLVSLLSGGNSAGAKGQAENILVNLAGLVTGVIGSDSSIGKEVVGGLFNKESADPLEKLAALFSELVEARTQGENGKVILAVSGLDRLAPAKAVELLEAMRDFFDCKGCVFVIAVDYSDILSGAQERYGQSFDEARGKHFFSGLFRMSFRVPASSYNLQNYVKAKLARIDIQTEDEAELELYVSLIQHSVGREPAGIDRLFDSFLLLKNTADEEMYESKYKRLALFALLCMQTEFRDVYDYAVRMKDSVTPEFLAGLCGKPSQLWEAGPSDGSGNAAFRDFASVFANIIDLDGETAVSEAECRAFAEVLEFSSITST
ncbi:MAG: hypothetical protein K2O45_07895 [Oscillospiraceae bacterium]|nr:hypothetical protein [Oscillospiraceae bacterium]